MPLRATPQLHPEEDALTVVKEILLPILKTIRHMCIESLRSQILMAPTQPKPASLRPQTHRTALFCLPQAPLLAYPAPLLANPLLLQVLLDFSMHKFSAQFKLCRLSPKPAVDRADPAPRLTTFPRFSAFLCSRFKRTLIKPTWPTWQPCSNVLLPNPNNKFTQFQLPNRHSALPDPWSPRFLPNTAFPTLSDCFHNFYRALFIV